MARLLVTLPAESVCRRLELLLGQPVIAPPVFEPAVDLSRGAGAALARALRFALSELDHAQAAAHAPLLRAALQDLLIGAMVAALPLAVRGCDADPPRAAPWQVRRAEAWLAAHAAEPVSIEDLARAISVPLRTIQHAFRRARGYSPRAFLHRCRLELARRLLEAGEGETVSSVALDCGFGHFGDFAAAYKARFGETPSATLQLRRR
jgi:AraC-like DNA-binding protein